LDTLGQVITKRLESGGSAAVGPAEIGESR
jgi:hypothetical protein